MAKLSANGTELYRLEKTQERAPTTEQHSYDAVSDRVVVSIRSNGAVLQKIITTFRDGSRHDYGWKKKLAATAKLKPGVLAMAPTRGEAICSFFLTNKGYTLQTQD